MTLQAAPLLQGSRYQNSKSAGICRQGVSNPILLFLHERILFVRWAVDIVAEWPSEDGTPFLGAFVVRREEKSMIKCGRYIFTWLLVGEDMAETALVCFLPCLIQFPIFVFFPLFSPIPSSTLWLFILYLAGRQRQPHVTSSGLAETLIPFHHTYLV
ncbi:hypothetical protein B0T13DRAFT_237546 [Neurospora crassa]|nr:hypothetical protein B0T13DRAFT_237546 [Neurospora crassa]